MLKYKVEVLIFFLRKGPMLNTSEHLQAFKLKWQRQEVGGNPISKNQFRKICYFYTLIG